MKKVLNTEEKAALLDKIVELSLSDYADKVDRATQVLDEFGYDVCCLLSEAGFA